MAAWSTQSRRAVPRNAAAVVPANPATPAARHLSRGDDGGETGSIARASPIGGSVARPRYRSDSAASRRRGGRAVAIIRAFRRCATCCCRFIGLASERFGVPQVRPGYARAPGTRDGSDATGDAEQVL
jgi:hypothetical protein